MGISRYAEPAYEPLETFDPLSVYDSTSIGNEFVPPHASLMQAREHEKRRTQIVMESWKETLRDSQRVPKKALAKTCKYDTTQSTLQSFTGWFVFLLLASCAGYIVGLIVLNLNS